MTAPKHLITNKLYLFGLVVTAFLQLTNMTRGYLMLLLLALHLIPVNGSKRFIPFLFVVRASSSTKVSATYAMNRGGNTPSVDPKSRLT